ncbi:MAG: type I-B CRISPR-associated protein Cas5 [Fretibacterium sp.]|nr:type I-B CRISPR-associated protein Cas5 [Fretibacterium sp.]
MAVIFDCSSSIAMFRKPYTTTSSVSFAFPPPSALAGLISAIIGLNNGADEDGARADYWDELSGTQVAVSILKRTRWLRAAINFWNVKNPQDNPHTQIKHQFVASPRYRVYVKGGVEERLRKKLKEGSFVYTPFLGVAYAIAQIDYLGECQDTPVESDSVEVSTVLPWEDEGMELELERCGGVFSELVPFSLKTDRSLIETIKVLYPADVNRPLCLRKRGGADLARCSVSGLQDVVAWFPEW